MWFKTIFRSNKRPAKHTRRGDAKAQTFRADEGLLRRLERLSLNAQRMLRGNPASGEHPSRQQMPTTIFSDHRPYSAGDDPRYVDWNAYARHEQIVVKLGETEQDIDVHILLDCSRSMGWGQPSKLLLGQQLVAALGYLALTQSDHLRLTPFNAVPLPTFGPAQSKHRALDMLRFVEQIRPGEHTALAQVLHNYARQFERGGMLVLCSDLLSDSPAALIEALRQLPPPRWQVLILHILDQRELVPAINGAVELIDAETGQHLDLTLDDDALALYKRNVATWNEQLHILCTQRGATYARVLTEWPLEQAVLPYLRMRAVLH